MKPSPKITVTVERLRHAGIPARFDTMDMDETFVSTKVADTVSRYLTASLNSKNPERYGLFITGPAQSSKTFLSVYVLRHFLAHGYTAKRFTHAELLELGLSQAGSGRMFLDYFNADIVCVDEIVTDTQKAGYTRPLIRVIKHCHDEGKLLLLVSELSFDQFISDYKTIVSLLETMFVPICLGSRTARLQASKLNWFDSLFKH